MGVCYLLVLVGDFYVHVFYFDVLSVAVCGNFWFSGLRWLLLLDNFDVFVSFCGLQFTYLVSFN